MAARASSGRGALAELDDIVPLEGNSAFGGLSAAALGRDFVVLLSDRLLQSVALQTDSFTRVPAFLVAAAVPVWAMPKTALLDTIVEHDLRDGVPDATGAALHFLQLGAAHLGGLLLRLIAIRFGKPFFGSTEERDELLLLHLVESDRARDCHREPGRKAHQIHNLQLKLQDFV